MHDENIFAIREAPRTPSLGPGRGCIAAGQPLVGFNSSYEGRQRARTPPPELSVVLSCRCSTTIRVRHGGRQGCSGRPTRHRRLNDRQFAREAHIFKFQSTDDGCESRCDDEPCPTQTPKGDRSRILLRACAGPASTLHKHVLRHSVAGPVTEHRSAGNGKPRVSDSRQNPRWR